MTLSLRNRFVADGVYTFGIRIVNMMIAAGLGILTARALGPNGRGIYALPMIDAAFVTATYAGISSATSYFLLRKEAGRAVLPAAFLTSAGFVVLGAVAALLIAAATGHAWSGIPAMLALPGPAALMLAYGYAVGTHRVRINTTLALFNTCLLLVVMVSAFFIAGRNPSSAILAWVVATDLLGAAVVVWILVDARTRLAPGTISTREFAAYSARTGLVSLVSLLNYRADVYVVAILTDTATLGLYTLAVTAAETLLTATQVTSTVTSPMVGSLDTSAAADLTARAVRHNVVVALACCAGLAVLAPIVVHLLYGAAFVPMVPALRVLLIGVFALSLGSPMASFFTLHLGKPEVPLVLGASSAVICVGVSIWLVPKMGLTGAALGSTVAYVLSQAAAIGYFCVISGIRPGVMLLPRRSDFVSYGEIAMGFARRLRRT